MTFDAASYSPEVAGLLGRAGGGHRRMPLAVRDCTSEDARRVLKTANTHEWFPSGRAPECALSGLWLYFGCFDEAHVICQDIATPEGSYWHAILHRQEPDASNAAYWFRRVGPHPIYPILCSNAQRILPSPPTEWDPFRFIDFCEAARRRPGSAEELAAQAVQLVEWQLLFDYCARPDAPG
jgi:hypothetical protein